MANTPNILDYNQYLMGKRDNPFAPAVQPSYSGGSVSVAPPIGGVPPGTNAKNYNEIFGELSSNVNRDVDELIELAQGDYDFAAKWIESAYKTARGENDAERAAFLKQVANELERKVGRIAFDYQTGTYRLNQDADLAESRTIQGRDLALARLDEDDRVYRRQFAEQTAQERSEQNTNLNARGLISAPREQQGGLGGKEIRMLETDITDRLGAYERELGRTRYDIGLSASQGLEDIGLARTRGLEDLTTSARRGAIDADDKRAYGLEENQRQLDARKQAAEMERKNRLLHAETLADHMARPKGGAY